MSYDIHCLLDSSSTFQISMLYLGDVFFEADHSFSLSTSMRFSHHIRRMPNPGRRCESTQARSIL